MKPKATPPPKTVTCAFCAREFVEDREQAVCRRCPLRAGRASCLMARCPSCGYENAVVSEWIGRWL